MGQSGDSAGAHRGSLQPPDFCLGVIKPLLDLQTEFRVDQFIRIVAKVRHG